MILQRFYEDSLAHASFLVGCAASHEAIVIDPNRDVMAYLQAAADESLRIVAVTETHIHADFVSGSRELAAQAGARLLVSDEGDADWKYGFAAEPTVRLLRDGDAISIGRVRLDVMHTPGHTPEHLAFVLTDGAATPAPLGVFTGDCLFVGDVGRPDLLERAAHVEGTMERSARTLFQTLQKLKRLPGHLLVWPSHGAGSACGKNLGGVPVSTLAYESMVNHGMRETDEDRFVSDILAGQPEPPVYFKEMKRLNKLGPPLLGGFRVPARRDGKAVLAALRGGVPVVDVRPAAAVLNNGLPGALNIPAGRAFTNWAGWLLPSASPAVLITDREADVAACVRALALIGLDAAGWADVDETLRAWRDAGGALESVPELTAQAAFERASRGELAVVDVRWNDEYVMGHVPGALHMPLGYLEQRFRDLPQDRLLAVHCAGGTRSPIALSMLRRLGFTRLANVPGGFSEYASTGLPVEQGEPTVAES